MPMPSRIVLMGAPGAGKGTQAMELAKSLGVPHLSTGDLLRGAVAERTALGMRADGYMRAGQLVPDSLVLEILKERIDRPDSKHGFVLDGYPRNMEQANALDAIIPIDLVLVFTVPESELMVRMTERRICPACGRTYNLVTLPPKLHGQCDVDGTELVHRTDDRPETVATRLRTFHAATSPVFDHYRMTGRLRSIDATGTPQQVRTRLMAAVHAADVAAAPPARSPSHPS
jgi:adenylate kinase